MERAARGDRRRAAEDRGRLTVAETAAAAQRAEPAARPKLSRTWANPLRDERDKRIPHIPGPCSLVIFGVTGDLSRRKLLPAIYDLANRGLLPPGFALVGFARREMADEDFGAEVLAAVKKHARTPFRQEVWDRLAEGIRFVQGSFDDDAAFDNLARTLEDLDARRGTGGNHAFYFAIPPAAFPLVLQQLTKAGLSQGSDEQWRRVVIEKPFGHDLASAQDLNALVNETFPEETVFRIDHYLGKETVQNILALRFANQLLEPIWNAHYVDHVQITMAEDIGLEGRAGYYDGIGAARDVIQNHLLQLLAFTAMEEPVSFDPHQLQAEKVKVLSATKLVEPLDESTARGQYAEGWQGAQHVVGLHEEAGFAPDSRTETYAAITLEVDTRRWAGVPFFLRTGKRLGKRVTEIAVVFKRAPHLPFDATMTEELGQNALVMRIQPDEGITMRFGAKVPGSSMEVRDVNMDFSYGEAFTVASPEAYERLILDVLLGVPSLFPVNEEVELSWRILDPVLDYWAAHGKPEPYESGTWGPRSADEMLHRTGREWRRP
ncbi:MAG: glucose-6-phosphate dehydrogenase [Mycobacteriaceae bacterium]|nr:glucose-6-phosphate dehydrogenase [Mycobacteriaceae bacterium]